jgi:hypothetical protein
VQNVIFGANMTDDEMESIFWLIVDNVS